LVLMLIVSTGLGAGPAPRGVRTGHRSLSDQYTQPEAIRFTRSGYPPGAAVTVVTVHNVLPGPRPGTAL